MKIGLLPLLFVALLSGCMGFPLERCMKKHDLDYCQQAQAIYSAEHQPSYNFYTPVQYQPYQYQPAPIPSMYVPAYQPPVYRQQPTYNYQPAQAPAYQAPAYVPAQPMPTYQAPAYVPAQTENPVYQQAHPDAPPCPPGAGPIYQQNHPCY